MTSDCEGYGCPYCHKRLNLLPSPHQDKVKVLGLKKARKYKVTPGVYHDYCYRNIKDKYQATMNGGVCDDMATCKVPE